MSDKQQCKSCAGSGMLSDDEGWQYQCSVCHGSGTIEEDATATRKTRIMSTDDNNRLLD